MSADLGLPWYRKDRLNESYLFSVVNDKGKRVAEFFESKVCDEAIACVNALNGIDPAKLPAVFEAIRGLRSVGRMPTYEEEVIYSAARAAGIAVIARSDDEAAELVRGWKPTSGN